MDTRILIDVKELEDLKDEAKATHVEMALAMLIGFGIGILFMLVVEIVAK